jgi:AbrB family looped-hinge helix DNA binding protein
LANVKVSEKGDKIVIPKKARDKFDIKPGDSLVVFGRGKKKKHLTIVKEHSDERFMHLKYLEDLDNIRLVTITLFLNTRF